MRVAHLVAVAAMILPGVVAGVPGTAGATPPSGVTGTIISRTTEYGTEYVVRRVTIAPGGTTGWHYHEGPVYALVTAGALTHTTADCTTTRKHTPGDLIIERGGPTDVHIGRNLGTVPVSLDVLYVKPAGAPLARDVANPGCY